MTLSLNDPVHVNRENRQLEGVVACLGPVAFADGDDWVGVRLTGASVGLGKNDGTVKGDKYFDCPPNCGLFVKRNLVQRRQLTRLEELRLKRELASSGDAPTPAPVARTPVRGAASASSRATPSASRTPGSAVKASSASTSTRLEEIRQRRAQLQGRTPTSSSNVSIASMENPSTPDEGSTVPQAQIDDLQAQIKSKDAEIESLKAELTSSKQDITSKTTEISSLQKELVEAKAAAPREEPEPRTPRPPASQEESESKIQQLQTQLDELSEEYKAYKKEAQQLLDQEKENVKKGQVELIKAKAESESLQKEVSNLAEQTEVRGAADTSHYKERAKLQAEVASLNRRVEQLELDKQDLENTVEDLSLDKEQLQEEKEALEDRCEELKVDMEMAQVEVDELRMELEESKAAQEAAIKAATATSSSDADGDDTNDAQDKAQNLHLQNSRLREALIRLREQSSVQQLDLTRQLRAAEKLAEEGKALTTELQTLRNAKTELEEQVSDLKDMVDQGSAYEVMVEDLSDRVLSLEEELMANHQTIRDLEEAADITAEMEEVQAEELKALSREMEERETVIRNLEEAIRMQRKREEDFQRTVSNYRASVETLKQEKKALLELQVGGEGEKSDLVSASQKALARAAQLVQDAAEMRKREAQAAIDRIDSQVRLHLAERLESMLPPMVCSGEIASIKGELLLSKVVGKASLSLDGIARSFSKTIRARAWEWRGDAEEDEVLVAEPIVLSDEQQQMAATMIHQSEVAHVAIDVSGDLLWLLSAGQWPDIVGPEASAELGSIMGHSMNDLDLVLGRVLNTLKEEGVLSPHQSNIGAFRQTVVSTMQTLRSHIEHDGESLIPMHWKPPALRLFRDASRAKFSSLGCYAAVASVLNHNENATSESVQQTRVLIDGLKSLLRKLDKASSEAAKSCLRLASLDVQDDSIVGDISGVADRWRAASDDLLGNIFHLLTSEEGITPDRLGACDMATEEVIRLVSQFSAVLRTANLNMTDDQRFHPFSPEVADVWEGVTLLARSIRAKDGDEDDVNYLVRTRAIESGLQHAVDMEPKLALANAKVASLEKSLSLRSKEIALQNTRLSELEKLLARTNAQPSPSIKSAELTSSEEINNLKQENRVLTEAMDVLHRQVEEYESEIRFMKDTKSPGKSRSRTPRRAFTSADRYSERSHSGDSINSMATEASAGAFEAALFRPALHAARREAAEWKTKATISTLLELPPLTVPIVSRNEEEKVAEEDMSPLLQLSSALASYRREVASMKVVDISKPRVQGQTSGRADLYSMSLKKASAANVLDGAATSARQWLESRHATAKAGEDWSSGPLVGRVRFAGQEPFQKIPTAMNAEDLYRLQLQLSR
eukprot:Nitzschia sp. Nitz4//scaffold271_size25734//7579//11815//NITZ4_008303-RA/size25734-snap-gene-0.22-mRNA-1//-1//CDS//3329545206//1164//frame0